MKSDQPPVPLRLQLRGYGWFGLVPVDEEKPARAKCRPVAPNGPAKCPDLARSGFAAETFDSGHPAPPPGNAAVRHQNHLDENRYFIPSPPG